MDEYEKLERELSDEYEAYVTRYRNLDYLQHELDDYNKVGDHTHARTRTHRHTRRRTRTGTLHGTRACVCVAFIVGCVWCPRLHVNVNTRCPCAAGESQG